MLGHGLDARLDWDMCHLTAEGGVMTEKLGQFIRAQYGAMVADVTTGLPLVPTIYDRRRIVSVSTDFERTVRSAYGVLRGLFNETPESSASFLSSTTDADQHRDRDRDHLSYRGGNFPTTFTPFVWHLSQNSDLALDYYYSWPSAMLASTRYSHYNDEHDSETLTIVNQSSLDQFGAIFGCPLLCAAEQTACALFAEDVTSCRISNNVPATPGTNASVDEAFLREMYPAVKTLQSLSNRYLYMADYRNLTAYWAHVGPYAKVALEQVMGFLKGGDPTTASAAVVSRRSNDDAEQSPAASDGASLIIPLRQGGEASQTAGGEFNKDAWFVDETTVLHLSAHDVTLYGIFVALDTISAAADIYPDSPARRGEGQDLLQRLLVPPFASTVFFEQWSDGSVSMRYAVCDQEYGGGYGYRFLGNSSTPPSPEPSLGTPTMRCTSSNGSYYLASRCRGGATEIRNTLSSLWPVGGGESSSSAPRGGASAPQCYQNTVDALMTRCVASALNPAFVTADEVVATNTTELMNSNCLDYRNYCPAAACASGTASSSFAEVTSYVQAKRLRLSRRLWQFGVAQQGASEGLTAQEILLILGYDLSDSVDGNASNTQSSSWVFNGTSLECELVARLPGGSRPSTVPQAFVAQIRRPHAGALAAIGMASLLLGMVAGGFLFSFLDKWSWGKGRGTSPTAAEDGSYQALPS